MTLPKPIRTLLPALTFATLSLLSLEALAAPSWGEFKADHCVSATHRQYSAVLWDIPWGDSWEDACAAMPASIEGFYFFAPDECVNTGLNMWGEFHVEDPTCDGTMYQPVNLALGRPTTQSSTAHGGVPGRAVDGNTDGQWANGSVSHTAAGPSWWQVDLGSVEPVGEVVIHNRKDCCKQLLHDFAVEVSVDGINWTSFSRAGLAKDTNHVLVNRQARYVRVTNPEVLHMAEVEVFRTRNIAYGKPTSQSSTAFGGASARAVDGNTNGEWAGGSLSHTGNGPGEWWQVDLEAMRRIGHVVLFNRTDCCADQLADFTVSVSNNGYDWTDVAFVDVAQPNMLIPINLNGRYVRVTNSQGYLHLAEVQVIESPLLPIEPNYGRGVGTIPNPGCGLGEVLEAGLCYGQCDPGYHGVGTTCWRDDPTIESVSAGMCNFLRIPLFSQIAEELDKALTSGVGLSLAAGAAASTEIGVAYGAEGEFGCYVSACTGFTTEFGLSVYGALGVYGQFSQIEGTSLVSSDGIGSGIPKTPIGISGDLSTVTDMQGNPIGTTISASIGLGDHTPASTPQSELICLTGMI